MRLTDLSVERNFLYNVRISEERLQRLQDQASSGKKFTRPQDDPIGVQRSINLNHHLAQNTQYLRNLDRARTWMENAESGLSRVTSILSRVHELGLYAITGTTPDDARVAIGKEIAELRDELANVTNWQVEGRTVLTGTMPKWQLGAGVSVQSDDHTTLLNDAYQALDQLAGQLVTGPFDRPTVESLLGTISTLSEEVLAQRAQNGARIQRIEAIEDKLQSLDIDFQRLISDVEDVDLTQILVRLKSAEASYQAALGAGARLIQPTLLDYLK